MHAFPTAEELYGVLKNLFNQVQRQPETVDSFAYSNLVVRVTLTEPSAQLLLDGRQPPMEVFYGPSPGQANFEITLKTDLLHQIWMGDVALLTALFNGEIATQGNLVRAQPFIELLQACGPIYKSLYQN